jgi:NADPH-dependent 2,4-dienoyl-CoA reductase/sulfur reductase-like enzyme
MTTRRTLLAAAGAALAFPRLGQAQAAGRVVVIGGGFAGATVARVLKFLEPKLSVTLVEANATYTACPLSNSVIAGLREITAQQFRYAGLAREGVTVANTAATGVDPVARTVTLESGGPLPYDRLVIAGGVDMRWDALPGYVESAAEAMPHAWKAGPQTLLLRRRLEAMEDGGLVVMSVPANPYRCPPGPYERASLIAHYLKTRKPRSKLLVLDAKDQFSKQRLFQNAWAQLYPNLEWVPLSSGGKVTGVDVAAGTVSTDFATHKPALANIIPPQRAAAIAAAAGAADRTGWCPVEPVAFESTLQKNIHVIGDAAVMGAMPKSAFSANVQAKMCAAALVDLMAGRTPREPRLINTCYSLVAPDYAISVSGVYKPVNGQLVDVPGSGGTSPLEASRNLRRDEAYFAEGWFNSVTDETFG